MAQLWQYRGWIWTAALGDLRYRYAGSGLGVFWNVISPLAILCVYLFVFTQLFGSRTGMLDSVAIAFPLYLSSGFLPWITFSEGLSRSTQAFLTNSVHLKRLAIPEIVFVAQSCVSTTVSMGIAIVLVLGVVLAFGITPAWSWLLVPLVLVLWQAFGLGLSLALSTINVFFRDVGQILVVVLQIWMWSIPVVYFEDILPPTYRATLPFNPAYPFLTALRETLFEGVPPISVWAAMLVWGLIACAVGLSVLARLRTEIRDLL
ncbi:MAG: ABC transporter permease [Chloroflexi bacterium]|nr:ABC transporter permease [Chloroflexota bacterium]MBV9894105.1 ABC transporter permease [Chloroflexota bacterium]